MKILRVKIKKERSLTSCKFTYPKAWEAQKIHVLAWGPSKGFGSQIEECLCVAPDDIGEQLVDSDNASVVSKTKANELGRLWRPQVAYVTDIAAVVEACEKVLSRYRRVIENDMPEILPVLEEENPTPGINKSKPFDIDKLL